METNGLVKTEAILPKAIEAVIIKGDLAPLNPEQRLSYYGTVCDSLGLNRLTKPFDYIVLNGKLTLYANKNCAEQLRRVYGVSITDVTTTQVGDLYCVTVKGVDKNGRCDSDMGVVPVKGLYGDKLANAMLKAVTKGKRRVTLSLCGLGMLDETEVETIPAAQTNVVNVETGEVIEVEPEQPQIFEYDIPEIHDDISDMEAVIKWLEEKNCHLNDEGFWQSSVRLPKKFEQFLIVGEE